MQLVHLHVEELTDSQTFSKCATHRREIQERYIGILQDIGVLKVDKQHPNSSQSSYNNIQGIAHVRSHPLDQVPVHGQKIVILVSPDYQA